MVDFQCSIMVKSLSSNCQQLDVVAPSSMVWIGLKPRSQILRFAKPPFSWNFGDRQQIWQWMVIISSEEDEGWVPLNPCVERNIILMATDFGLRPPIRLSWLNLGCLLPTTHIHNKSLSTHKSLPYPPPLPFPLCMWMLIFSHNTPNHLLLLS